MNALRKYWRGDDEVYAPRVAFMTPARRDAMDLDAPVLDVEDQLAQFAKAVKPGPPLTIPEMADQIAKIDQQISDEHKFCIDLARQREELSALLMTAVALGKEQASAFLTELGRIETAHKNGHAAPVKEVTTVSISNEAVKEDTQAAPAEGEAT